MQTRSFADMFKSVAKTLWGATPCMSFLAVVLLLAAFVAPRTAVADITKQSILEWTRIGVPPEDIINTITVQRVVFDLSTLDVVELTDAGVHESVIKFMLASRALLESGAAQQSTVGIARPNKPVSLRGDSIPTVSPVPHVLLRLTSGYLFNYMKLSGDSDNPEMTYAGHGLTVGLDALVVMGKRFALDTEFLFAALLKARPKVAGESLEVSFKQYALSFGLLPTGFAPALDVGTNHFVVGAGTALRNRFGGELDNESDTVFDGWSWDIVAKLGLLIRSGSFVADIGVRVAYSMVSFGWASPGVSDADPTHHNLLLTVNLNLGGSI